MRDTRGWKMVHSRESCTGQKEPGQHGMRLHMREATNAANSTINDPLMPL